MAVLHEYLLLRELYVALLVLLHSFVVVLALEGVEPQQHHMCYDAEAEHVTLAVVHLLLLRGVVNYLKGHVAHGSAALKPFLICLLPVQQRQSKVDQLRGQGLGINHDVLRFKVPVHYFLTVDMRKPLQNFAQYHYQVRDAYLDLLLVEGHKILACQVLEHKNKGLIFLKELLHSADIVGVEDSEDLLLLLDYVLGAGPVLVLLGDNLDRILSLVVPVLGQVDLR